MLSVLKNPTKSTECFRDEVFPKEIKLYISFLFWSELQRTLKQGRLIHYTIKKNITKLMF